MNLLVVGSVAFDAIETPFGKTDKIIGGAGTFISLAASYAAKPQVVSVVGGDFPNEYLELLKQHNIDIEGIQIKKDEKTFFWSGKYHNDMNSRDTLVTELNCLETFVPVVPKSYQDTDFVLLGNLSPVVQRQVIEQMPKRPKLIIMDTMNFWMDIMLGELKRTISMVDVLSINDEEARQLSGEYSLVTAAKKIQKMGPKYVIIKKGEHGALLFFEDKIFFAPALPLEEVFDPTGAGDTFAGGFAGYLASKGEISFENMKNAVVFGSALASFCVEKFGTEKIQKLSEKEISIRVSKFVDLVSFNFK
ncbi:MAG: bifunctional hydroxymethylpyrimidine kinase/phosphomethylpyrimidine kinase [Bacteroidales bacterium]|nr:bifunctional hydroxymethylpyrimidine kinase/phosphomethylpyrimidine kinase [Bacteroidales bacterium]MBN2755612.1 bifunctional hydroxymethylpyrimidine kinase/phosphomethylpyrimidine kinase [Bacteroidales bacterium]